MVNLPNRRMWKYILLEFFDRISLLDSNTGYNNQFRRRIPEHMTTDDMPFLILNQLTETVSLFILRNKPAGISHR